MSDYDGLDIEIITESRPLGDGSVLRTRGVVLNGQEIGALEGAEVSIHSRLGKHGAVEATFTVLAKSVHFRKRTDDI